MRLAGIQLLLCATLFCSISELHSQTTGHPAPPALHATPPSPSWHTLYEENFEGPAPFSTSSPPWAPDTFQNADEFSDGGSYFQKQNITPPVAYRAEAPFGEGGWLTVAAYSRSNLTKFSDLFDVVPDPANPANHVLRVASPAPRAH